MLPDRTPMPNPVTLLVDNGSLAAAATRQLRVVAGALAQKIGRPVAPVSLLHSAAVPVAELDGVPAEIFESAIARRLKEGHPGFLVVPLFFGPSRALTDYLPERVAQLRLQHPELHVGVAPVLFEANDGRLAQIMADHVRSAAQPPAGGIRRIALVDHGSPVAAVTAVRDALARQLAQLLGAGAVVGACSMERREGRAYDFNEPLLASLLARDGWNRGNVTVAMQFLLPGRHAGPSGDVAKICQKAMAAQPGLQTQLTPLVGEHPQLVEILADRWRSGWKAIPS